MNTNNSFRIKNSRNEQATIWPIGNNTYFCSIKWDDRDSTMTVSKNAVDSLVECGEWNIVQEDKLSNLPDTFKFVTDVCEDHDGNVYTCTILKDFSHPRITWIDEDGNRQISGSYCKDTIQKYIENGTWKILEEEDEQEPDLMNYLYEIIRSGKDDDKVVEDNQEQEPHINKLVNDLEKYIHCMSYNDSYFGEPEGFLKQTVRKMKYVVDEEGYADEDKEFVPTSFKYRHVDYPEQIGTFTATSPTTGIVTYDNQEGPCTYWDSKQAENFVQRGVWRVIPPSEYVEDFDEALDNADIIRLISDFTASSDHYFVIEKGQLNVYHGDNSIPYTCENEDEIVTVMNAIETLDGYSKG